MSTTLPLFWHLSSVLKKERIDASVKLVGALEQFQTQFAQKPTPGTSGSDDEDEDEDEDATSKSDGLDLLNAQDVSYSIRRLVRGLASSREQSRLGFAVALTELLSRIDTVTCSQITNLIIESTKHLGSMTGQEERDVLFGQLFGIMSVVQSGLVVRTKPLATSASSSTAASSAESFVQIITRLVELGEKKSWLRESAWFTISLATDALHRSDAQWKAEALDHTLELLFQINAVWSTEKVAVALKLQDQYPQRDWRTLLTPTFKTSDLLNSGNLATISRILKESTADDEGQKDQTKAPSATWKPQLNFAWEIILEQMLPGPNSQETAKGSFQDFFRIVVDESLFSSTASAQRKLWGFQVFQKALKRVTEDSMPMLFTKNFMRSWINHLSKKDRHLHQVALQTAKEVQDFVNDKPQLGFALILQLTGPNGSQQFDKLTRTKTVESILSSLDPKGIQSYIDHLFSLVDERDIKIVDVAATNARRAWIIDQLGILIRNGKIPKEDGWILSILDWLTVHGLFIIKKKSSKSPIAHLHSIPTPAFSDELRRNCRNRLLSCLSDLASQTTVVKNDDKLIKLAAVASNGEFWISKVLARIEQLENDTKHASLLTELDEEDQILHGKARDTISKLRKILNDQQESAKGAELILLGTLLQRYCASDDDDDADGDALGICIDAASRMHLADSKKKKVRKSAAASEEPFEEPVDVLVDAIIGFLEKSTAYMRTVGNQVFSLLSGSVKESTIDLIVTQLERRDSSELLEDEEEEEEMDVADDGEEDEGEVNSDENSDLDEDDESGVDSNEEEADLELRNKIEEALRVNGIEPATGETDSEEEELMDDEQMMAIDEQLAQVFCSRANEGKAGKSVDAQREATHFKNRVLDLVDTYLKKQPSNPLVLRVMTPLVDIIATSGQDERQLADKARGILRARFGKAKEIPMIADAEQATLILANLHTQARKSHSSDHLAVLSLCSIYVAKILINLNANDPLAEIYTESLTDFATRKNSGLNAHFFQDFIKRYPASAWSLRQKLMDITTKAINSYRQCQILQLLDLLVSLLPSLPEHTSEVAEFMPLLSETLLAIATDSCSDKGNLSAAQLKDVFKFALSATRYTKRMSPAATESVWQPKLWSDLQRTLQKSKFKTSPTLHKMCEHIVHTSSTAHEDAISKATVPKRKMEEVDEITPVAAKKSKRI
ncbi:hypothetical protein BDN70DRAFT_914180 [Pholiota conissans]|uniref:DNA polymerase V n=1 Tax=Pholiota conissans TaxID=109636 RepID=A0A9P5YYF2_9AGAR|nr:hypothetical protein BDN70DRAFT_914180 [Pholiota conissans]